MLNNEFRIIGTVVSDFEPIPNSESFPKKKLVIEIEGKKMPRQYPITIYEKNGLIDTTKTLEGKVVIMTGYIDCYKEYVHLIAQDLVVVGAGTPEFKEIKPSGVAASLPSSDKEEEPKGSDSSIDITEDDLPF